LQASYDTQLGTCARNQEINERDTDLRTRDSDRCLNCSLTSHSSGGPESESAQGAVSEGDRQYTSINEGWDGWQGDNTSTGVGAESSLHAGPLLRRGGTLAQQVDNV